METNEENQMKRNNGNPPSGFQRSVSIRQNPDGTLSKVWTLRKYVHAEPKPMFNADQATDLTNSEPQEMEISHQRSAPDSFGQLEENSHIRARLTKLRQQQRFPDARKFELAQYNRNLRELDLRRKYMSMLQQTPEENYYEYSDPSENIEDHSYLSKERLWGGNNQPDPYCSYPNQSTPINANCARTPVRSCPRPSYQDAACTSNQANPAAGLMNDLLNVSNRQMMSPNQMNACINRNNYLDDNMTAYYQGQSESMLEAEDAGNVQELAENDACYYPTAQLIKRFGMEKGRGRKNRRMQPRRLVDDMSPQTEIPVVSTLLCSSEDSTGINGGPPFQVGMNIKCIPGLVRLGQPRVDRAWNNPIMPGLIAAVQRVEDVYNGEILSDDGYDNAHESCERSPQRLGANDTFSQGQNMQCPVGPSPTRRQYTPENCPLPQRSPPPSQCDNIPSSTPGRSNQPAVRRLSKQMTQTEANEILDELIEITVQGFNKLSEILRSGVETRCKLNNAENKKTERELEESLRRAENDLAEMRKSMQSTLMDIVQVIGKRSVLNVPEIREMVLSMQDERCGQSPKKSSNPTKEPSPEKERSSIGKEASSPQAFEENTAEAQSEEANPPDEDD